MGPQEHLEINSPFLEKLKLRYNLESHCGPCLKTYARHVEMCKAEKANDVYSVTPRSKVLGGHSDCGCLFMIYDFVFPIWATLCGIFQGEGWHGYKRELEYATAKYAPLA